MTLGVYDYNHFMTVAATVCGDDSPSFIEDLISYSEICRFCALTARELMGKEDMVLCDKCRCWYHCSCIGIARNFHNTSIPFYCCQPPTGYMDYV